MRSKRSPRDVEQVSSSPERKDRLSSARKRRGAGFLNLERPIPSSSLRGFDLDLAMLMPGFVGLGFAAFSVAERAGQRG